MMFIDAVFTIAPWYKSEDVQDILQAWEDGKDFKMNGHYTSIRDIKYLYQLGVERVELKRSPMDKEPVLINTQEYFEKEQK